MPISQVADLNKLAVLQTSIAAISTHNIVYPELVISEYIFLYLRLDSVDAIVCIKVYALEKFLL